MMENNNMEKRLELEKRGRQAAEIKELNLDNCRSTQICGLTDEFVNLTTLSLINVGLTSLKGFPNLPNLKRLELSDNRLCSNLNQLSGCPKLTHLNLSGNKIKDHEALIPLKDLPELKNLDLFNCEITSIEGYREKVFETIPALVYLDGFDKDDEEGEEEDEEDSPDESENGEGSENGVNGDGAHVNGEEEDDDDEDDDGDSDEDDDEDDEDEEVGLSYLQKSGLEDEDSEGEDFAPNGDMDDDEDDDEDEESGEEEEEDGALDGKEKSPAVDRGRGIKRKRAADDIAPAAEAE